MGGRQLLAAALLLLVAALERVALAAVEVLLLGLVPALVAAANPVYTEAAKSATLLVSASVVVTAILVPLITAWWAGRVNRVAK